MFEGPRLFAGLEDGNSIIGWSGWFLTGDASAAITKNSGSVFPT
jgi:hypothetical protein